MYRFALPLLLAFLLIITACTGASPQVTPDITTPQVITPIPTPTATLAPALPAPETVRVETVVVEPSPTLEPTAIRTEVPEPTPVPILFPPSIQLEPFITVPNQITYLTHAGDGSGRIFLVEKRGRVRIIEAGQIVEKPFLDMTNLVESGGSEQGLLSIAFDPDYETNGEFYVNYTSRNGNGDTAVARYRVSVDPNVADAATGNVIMTIDQPAGNHNGGQLQFGPDGYLYIGTGDGGRADDPWDNAENFGVLLGKILRVAVRGQDAYAIPQDNPFVAQDQVRAEIWAYGLRNPWRFSFDRDSGDLYIADVGQNQWEEVNVQPAGSSGGEHYGWDTTEGFHCFEPSEGCDTSAITMPVTEYGHDQGCSITGGYVYRGTVHPQYDGIYFYADFCSGDIWALQQEEDGSWREAIVYEGEYRIASFGEDETGELYVLDLSGAVYRMQAEGDR